MTTIGSVNVVLSDVEPAGATDGSSNAIRNSTAGHPPRVSGLVVFGTVGTARSLSTVVRLRAVAERGDTYPVHPPILNG